MAKQRDPFERRYSLWPIIALLFLLTACGSPAESPQSETPTASSLERLEISPAAVNLAAGTQLSLQVTGLYSDGSRRVLEQRVTWRSVDSSVASVDSSGRLSGLTADSTRVRASLDGLSVEVPVQITAAQLNRIEIAPDAPRLPGGTSLNLTATGLFSDGSRQALGDQVNWTSADPTLFSITADRQLQALAVGSGVLRASLNGVFGQTTVQVSDAKLTALRVTPASPEFPAGSRLSLGLLGLYSDGSQQDLTTRAQWQSDDASVATLDPALSAAVLLGVSAGDTRVRASVDGLSLDIPVRVSQAILSTLELDVGADELPAGLSRSLRAIGHFSDGSVQDLTRQVTWRSSDDGLLAVANAAGSEGLATALVAGAVKVSASLDGIAVSRRLVVSSAVLRSLELEPVAPRLAAGTELPVNAIGRYSDGSLRVLNDVVSWFSDDVGTAAVTNGGEQPGLLKGLAVGQTSISVRLGNVTASLPVAISAASLMAIDISPSMISMAAGASLALRAVGSFSDGSTQPLNAAVEWESSEAALAAIGPQGSLQALRAGTGRVSASFGGVTGSVPFTVSAATLQRLEIGSASPALASGTEMAFSVVAIYSDGSRQDVTSQAVWDSDDVQVLSVSNGENSAGLGRAGNPGSSVVRVRFQGQEASRPVTVNAATITGLRLVAPGTGLASGESMLLNVFADFSDGSSQPLGREVVWSSDDPLLASVGNTGDSRGRVIAGETQAGTVRIRAEHAGFSVEQALTITLDPQRPVSLVVLPSPNVLLNDGLDSSRISLRLQAADATQTVTDGTLVDVSVSQDGVNLLSTTVATSAGEAGLDFTTSASGLLEVEASVQGSDVKGRGVLYAGPNILAVALPAAFADAPSENGVVLAGARFGFFLFNTSNRSFPLDAFVFSNGGDTVGEITDPASLNGGILGGGDKFGIVLKLSEDLLDQGLSATYYLRDPSTNQGVTYRVVYSQLQ